MKKLVFLILVSLVNITITFSQDEKYPLLKKFTLEDFLGIWEAFNEGTIPDKEKGEEPSKVVIFKDSEGRIVVFIAHLIPGDQFGREGGVTRYLYGTGIFKDGCLYFKDQDGFEYQLIFGYHIYYGYFLSVSYFYMDEAGIGDFLKIKLKPVDKRDFE